MHFQTKISQITMYFQSKNTKNDAFQSTISFGLTEYIMFMADVMHIKEVSSFLVKGELPSMVDLLPTFMGSSRLTIHSGTHI